MAIFAFVGAQVSWATLERALEARGGGLTVGDVVPDGREEDAVSMIEFGGTVQVEGDPISYHFHADLIANLSAELSTLAVLCMFEAVSGTCELVAARNGEALRHYSFCTGDKKALDRGKPLPGETRAPLSTFEGLSSALRDLGFDLEGAHSHGVERTVVLPEGCPWEKESSPLDLRKVEKEHFAKYRLPPDQYRRDLKLTPEFTVLEGGRLGVSIRMVQRPWYARLWNRFTRR
jgi:hypothetical protein